VSLVRVESLDDPRVALYRNLKDRELERRGRHFIAEGEHLVRRLLDSDFPIDSVMLADRRVDELAPIVPEHVPLYVVPQSLMNEILGLKFHSGVLACARRKPPQTLDEVVAKDRDRLTLVICPDINNVENIGSLIRLAAGFGADAMILGERCHDPFWRQSVRVSMGTIFRLPLLQTDGLARDMRRLRDEWIWLGEFRSSSLWNRLQFRLMIFVRKDSPHRDRLIAALTAIADEPAGRVDLSQPAPPWLEPPETR